MKLFRRKMSRRNRNLISGLLVGGAAIYLVAYYLEIPGDQLAWFLFTSIAFVAGIILLAVLAIVVIKGLGRLSNKVIHGRDDSDDSRQ